MIPYGRKYKTKMVGYRWKFVECSFCGCKYLYKMKREAEGEGGSVLWLDNAGAKGRAINQANEVLNSKLSKEIDAVSCPDCGMYQKDMVSQLKREKWSLVGCGSIVFGVIGGIIVLIGNNNLATASVWLKYSLLIILIGLWLWVVIKMAIDASKYKPNDDAQKRIGQASSDLVLRLSEWEAIYDNKQN